MRTEKLRIGFRVVALCLVVGAPATAFAHAYVMQPPPRDVGQPDLNLRAHKTGPCGAVPRTGKPTQYDAGAQIQVKWEETIAHQGCFQVAFSPANDTNFTTLLQLNDPAGMLGTPITQTVTLPPGVETKAGTLVVRQLMNNAACTGNTANPMDPALAAGGTYYSCADICVGAECQDPDSGAALPDASTGDDAATPDTDSGGPTTEPTDGGGKTVPPGSTSGGTGSRAPAADDGGCSIALGATSGVSFTVTAGLFALALLRRRRARNNVQK